MDEELLIAFDSTQQALRAEMLLEYAGIEIDIFPTPKEITAGCAMSIQFFRGALGEVRKIVEEQSVEIRGIFREMEEGGYALIGEKEGLDE
ncbi:DUF3343 domain-containing protein [Paenibacillus graminis]|uniref:Putative Se/S carrier protein-like domain-containing protein n=1 Tax=Paenibacillus graminis TaxID=189425 RepID=A0A089NRS1_9BACL|nr:DUF3343 domain-containing protein [Paenibacillus graminis]AIQ71779.1 hypothetical protein PGRAT_32450 [Paenibacillus graminis]